MTYDCVIRVRIIAIGTPLVSRELIDCTIRTTGFQSAFSCEFPLLMEASNAHPPTTGWQPKRAGDNASSETHETRLREVLHRAALALSGSEGMVRAFLMDGSIRLRRF